MQQDERILVVTLSNIGDVVMTTPVLEALAQHHPDCKIDIVADRRSSTLLQFAPYTGQIFHREKGAGWHAQWRLLRALRQQPYRACVDLRTKMIPWLVRAQQRVINRRGGEPGRHAVEAHYAVLEPLLDIASPPPCRLYLDPDSVAQARALLQSLPGRQWLAVAPGANWPGKRWPVERYHDLLKSSAQLFDGIIVLGSGADTARPLDVAELNLPCLDVSGRTTLNTAAALLARASVFVGNDSGLGHMAAALGIPTLTLFGPGEPQRYRPWGPYARIMLAPNRNLNELSVAAVATELGKLRLETEAIDKR